MIDDPQCVQHLVQKNDIFCTWVPRASPGPSGVVPEPADVFQDRLRSGSCRKTTNLALLTKFSNHREQGKVDHQIQIFADSGNLC